MRGRLTQRGGDTDKAKGQLVRYGLTLEGFLEGRGRMAQKNFGGRDSQPWYSESRWQTPQKEEEHGQRQGERK